MKKELIITGSMLTAILSNAGEVSRAELQLQLDLLAEKPAPQKLSMGAMCYDMAPPANRIEYACPVCNEKTIFLRSPEIAPLAAINLYRQLVNDIRTAGFPVKLDETAFCHKCAKPDTAKKLALVIPLDGGKYNSVVLQNDIDLKIMLAFLKKQDKVQLEQGREEPLKKYIPRLKELLELQ